MENPTTYNIPIIFYSRGFQSSSNKSQFNGVRWRSRTYPGDGGLERGLEADLDGGGELLQVPAAPDLPAAGSQFDFSGH